MLPLYGEPPVFCKLGTPNRGLPKPHPRARWYVARVKSKLEKRAAHELRAVGLSYFLPMQPKQSNESGQTVTRMALLLPCFIFFLARTDEFHRARDTRRLRQILYVKDQVELRDDLKSLARFVRHATFDRWEKFTPGTRVRVVRGPMKGSEGLVDLREKNKVFITCAMLGAGVFLVEDPTILKVIP